jgi:hypothetical protein
VERERTGESASLLIVAGEAPTPASHAAPRRERTRRNLPGRHRRAVAGERRGQAHVAAQEVADQAGRFAFGARGSTFSA